MVISTRHHPTDNPPQLLQSILGSLDAASMRIMVQSNNSNGVGSAVISTVESSIASLMEDLSNKKCRDKKYMVHATITKVRNATSCSYLSCVICKGMVHLEGTNYVCSKCMAMNESPIQRYRLNIDIKDQTMTTTITAFNKEAEGLVGKSVDEMLNTEKMENGAKKDEDIFQHTVGCEADFEFRPTNHDMNTSDPMLTAKRISKKTNEPTLTGPASQASQVNEYSASFDSASGSSGKETSSAVDIKGKSVISQDGDNVVIAEKISPTLPPTTRTSGKRGIIINEVGEESPACGCESAKSKVQEKRRKK